MVRLVHHHGCRLHVSNCTLRQRLEAVVNVNEGGHDSHDVDAERLGVDVGADHSLGVKAFHFVEARVGNVRGPVLVVGVSFFRGGTRLHGCGRDLRATTADRRLACHDGGAGTVRFHHRVFHHGKTGKVVQGNPSGKGTMRV